MKLFKRTIVFGPTFRDSPALSRRAAGNCADAIGPYGQLLTPISSTTAVSQYKYGGKEWSGTTLSYDFGARNYLPALPRWSTMDPLAERYYSVSPYVYCAGNPVNRIDVQGKWDITVHVYKNRLEHGYGIAIVTNRKGEEIYRFQVRVQGVNGSNRMITGSDTPLGLYDIPSDRTWINGGSRLSYGPHARLNMVGSSGEIINSGRTNIRIHGGRQELLQNGEWFSIPDPQLKKTYGCIRAYDTDMSTIKSLTDCLMAQDDSEIPGYVEIVDDLERVLKPSSENNLIEVMIHYAIPDDLSVTYERIRKQLFRPSLIN